MARLYINQSSSMILGFPAENDVNIIVFVAYRQTFKSLNIYAKIIETFFPLLSRKVINLHFQMFVFQKIKVVSFGVFKLCMVNF